MEDYVRLREVKKIYKMGEVEIAAADGIDFSVGKGEFAVVVGASGAGKTTVLNILGGMDTATSGEVIVDGNDITTYNTKQLTAYRRDDIGFVFQFYNLFPNLSALENVEKYKTTVPSHLQDAHYKGAQNLGRGTGYKYAHDYPDHYVKQQYLPDEIKTARFYEPGELGYEKVIGERLKKLRSE